MVYAFLHLALALYRDYTTHKIYEGRKSKHVIILLMKEKKKKNDYNTEEEEEKKESGEERQTETGNVETEQE